MKQTYFTYPSCIEELVSEDRPQHVRFIRSNNMYKFVTYYDYLNIQVTLNNGICFNIQIRYKFVYFFIYVSISQYI